MLCCVAKGFERIIVDHIMEYLENAKILSNTQFGFRSKSNTIKNLTFTYDRVTQLLERKCAVDIIYIDLAKAFDKVPHDLLLRKLLQVSINPFIVKWISNYLSNRNQRVIINGKESSLLPVPSGVLQGSIIGPTLFLIYLNDFLEGNLQNSLSAFADDCKIFGIVSPQLSLQDDLYKLEKWWDDNLMKINEEKCKLCIWEEEINIR